jgi:hypothetical protein
LYFYTKANVLYLLKNPICVYSYNKDYCASTIVFITIIEAILDCWANVEQ